MLDPMEMAPDVAEALSTSAFLTILLLTVLIGYAIRRTGFQWATEGSVALLLGLATGGAMFLYYWIALGPKRVPRRLVTFDEAVFFQTLLPPIIFSAGFSVKKKLFFRNFVTLVLFGVVGTLFTAGVMATSATQLLSMAGLPRRGLLRTCLALGAVLSCTDSVATLQLLDAERAPLLYSLLFGEGVVNDATAIVLLGATAKLPFSVDESDVLAWSALGQLALQFLRLFAASTALGLAVGVASAALIRWLFRGPPSPDREVLAVGLLGLLAYYLAEALELSAILSVFFCGIAMSHYTWHNLSPAAKVITRHGFHIISACCETVLFVYAGLDLWVTAGWWSQGSGAGTPSLLATLGVSGGLLLTLLAARAAFTFPLCAAANRLWRRRDPIPPPTGPAVLWWGGLPRGAITLALAYHTFYEDTDTRPEHRMAIAAVIGIVVFTTVGFGVITQPIMAALLPAPAAGPTGSAGPGKPHPGPVRPSHSRAGKGGGAHTPGAGGLGASGHGTPLADGDLRVSLLRNEMPLGAAASALIAAADGADCPSAPPLESYRGDWYYGEEEDANDQLWRGEVPGMPSAPPLPAHPPPSTTPFAAPSAADGMPGAPHSHAHATSRAPSFAHGGGGAAALSPAPSGFNTPQQRHQSTAAVVGGSCEMLVAGPEEEEQRTWIHTQWRRLDARWLQPLFGGSRGPEPDVGAGAGGHGMA